jgi:four helix bundle protein
MIKEIKTNKCQSFRELRVWQVGKALAVRVYSLTKDGEISRDYGLAGQMQRAAVSVASNIAEGYERNSDKEFVRFLLIAKGSLSELRTQLEIAREIKYVHQDRYNEIEQTCKQLAGMLTNLIKARKKW